MPSRLTFRRAEPSDLPAVSGLRQEATDWLAGKGLDQWQPGQPRKWSPAGLRDAIDRATCYLAYDGDHLVGTITVDRIADPEFWTPQEQAEPAVYLHRMMIVRSRAGQQLGRELLDFADGIARSEGAVAVRLDAWKDNEALHRYYQRQGFRHVRTVDLSHRGSGALFERTVRGPA
jgi:GNAT superfamily N-acetyltransferase